MALSVLANLGYAFLLSLVAGIPLLLLLGCCLPSLRTISFRLLPVTPLPALLAALFSAPEVEVQVPWFFMGGVMGLDATGRVFLGLTAVVWLFSSLSVRDRFREDPHRFSFAGFFLASMGANFGLIMARDILGFYLFFALMSFSAYGLVIHNRTQAAMKAGRVYLMLVFLSELSMFTALVLLSGQGTAPLFGAAPVGDFSMLLLILLFITFGVKVGALPLHSWMVLSYQEIPVPAATALAGAMVNAGILGWLRFLPFGHAVLPDGAAFFMLFGAAAALYGVLYGLYQEKIGRVLAASSISQMGLLTLIVGYGLLSEEGGRSALVLLPLFAVHHSLAKSSLFLGYDLIDQGVRLRSTVLLAGLLLPCLSLAGLPLTSGAMVKGGLKELTALGPAPGYLFGKVFLPLSSTGTTILMLHCIRLFRRQDNISPPEGKTRAAWLWLVSVIGVAAIPWLWTPLRHLGSRSLQGHAMLQSLWPVTLGIVLALAWFVGGRRLPGRGHAAPDFDALSRTFYEACMRMLQAVTDALKGMGQQLEAEPLKKRFGPVSALIKGPGRWEKVLGRWSVVGLCYLVICLLFFLLIL